MYAKGANIIHTLRQLIDDDEKFRTILKGLNKEFYHEVISSKQLEDYISQMTGKNLSKFFDQYLRTNQIPVLELKVNNDNLEYRWTNCIAGFNMPVKLNNGEWLTPSTEWAKTKATAGEAQKLNVDVNFYINTKRI